MRRYLAHAPRRAYSPDVRLVHNFYPGPRDDPGRDRKVNLNGFRVWITDEPPGSRAPTYFTDVFDAGDGSEHRCFCGWLDGREHYGTVGYVDERGNVTWRGEVVSARESKDG
jgi:hypothetical protein